MAVRKRAIAVWWEDAFSHDGWTSDAQTIIDGKCLVLSVGVELANNDDGITLAVSCNAADQNGGVWKIPRGMVRKIRVLGRLELPEEG
jgi:hypothetical protein